MRRCLKRFREGLENLGWGMSTRVGTFLREWGSRRWRYEERKIKVQSEVEAATNWHAWGFVQFSCFRFCWLFYLTNAREAAYWLSLWVTSLFWKSEDPSVVETAVLAEASWWSEVTRTCDLVQLLDIWFVDFRFLFHVILFKFEYTW